MKIQLYLILIFNIYVNVNAQEIKFPIGTTFQKQNFEKKELEESNTNAFYKYTYINDKETLKKNEALTLLSIGKDYTKFYDYNRFLYERALDSINKSKTNYTINDVNYLFKFRRKVKFKPIIFGQFIDGEFQFVFQNNIHTNKFQYNYGKYKLDWKLNSNTKKIGNYYCKEATLNYAGRKWIAYYTEDIPLSFGPYIFGGLPGLILEIYDNNKEHHFSLEAINFDKMSIYIDNLYSKKKIDRKEFEKGLQNFYDNPEEFLGKSYSSPGVEELIKPIPYNPIELE
ncbi:GLPGLI family protein [Chishuiella sp.]|uniref:GLPGLI family protein n=1 Tax=Chishuiella sp. TaxID=1969467 RepID=UPI0028AD8638|nr:GLPGLI family protein [Chishuiella sp.]